MLSHWLIDNVLDWWTGWFFLTEWLFDWFKHLVGWLMKWFLCFLILNEVHGPPLPPSIAAVTLPHKLSNKQRRELISWFSSLFLTFKLSKRFGFTKVCRKKCGLVLSTVLQKPLFYNGTLWGKCLLSQYCEWPLVRLTCFSSFNTAMPHNIGIWATEGEREKCTKLHSQCNFSESGPQTLVCTEHKNTVSIRTVNWYKAQSVFTWICVTPTLKQSQHWNKDQHQLSLPELHSVLTVWGEKPLK